MTITFQQPQTCRVSSFIPAAAVLLLYQPARSQAQVPVGPQPHAVVTHHNDNARTGVNPSEPILRPGNVSSDQFQLLYKLPIRGQVYAQPLFVPRVPDTFGTLHNYIIVATQKNQLTIWDQLVTESEVSAGATPTPAGAFLLGEPVPYNYMPLGETRLLQVFTCPNPPAPTYSCWPNSDVSPPPTPTIANPTTGFPYTVFPWIGVLSTPVVDTSTMRLYVVAMTWPVAFQLHCFDLSRLQYCAGLGPVTIAGEVHGSSADNVNGTVWFNPQSHFQRPALLLANHRVYIAFGTHSEWPTWHGWVFAYDAATLEQKAVWCSTPNGDGAAIWQAGAGPAADESGNLYVMTGNADKLAPATWTASGNFPMSFVKLDPNLSVLASFMIPQAKAMSDRGMDLGSSGPVLLGPNTVVGAGKQGILYNLDRNLVKRQEFQASSPPDGGVNAGGSNYHHVHGVPIVWRDGPGRVLVYLWAERDSLKVFPWYDNSARFDATHLQASDTAGPGTYNNSIVPGPIGVGPYPVMPGGALSLSTNGSPGSAIVWASLNRQAPPDPALDLLVSSPAMRSNANPQIVAGVLRAYDAENLRNELWNSDRNPARDSVGRFAKSTPPTVTYGRVFMATFSDAVNVYGLRNGANFIDESVNGQTTPSGPPIQLTVTSGQTFTASVTIANTGFTVWRSADHYALGLLYALGVRADWGTERVSLPKDVAPYETVRIEWNAVAPTQCGQPTMRAFRWSMAQDGVGWFGDSTADVFITILPSGPCAAHMSVAVKLTGMVGNDATIQVTVTDPATHLPIGGATVTVSNPDTGTEEASNTTGPDGTASLTYSKCRDPASKQWTPCDGLVTADKYAETGFAAPSK